MLVHPSDEFLVTQGRRLEVEQEADTVDLGYVVIGMGSRTGGDTKALLVLRDESHWQKVKPLWEQIVEIVQ